ncbi:MAG: CDP-diacylglycerol O-phosphatidyltransferase [Myxococcota bacterium]
MAQPANHAPENETGRVWRARAVHALTASGAVLGTLSLWEIARERHEWVATYLLIALGIDAIDGTLARRAQVTRYTPGIDGRRLDDIVDFLNFAVVPIVWMLSLGAFLHPALAALPILASAYGFSQEDAKTEDDFFLGWPSYWNLVALYVWMLALSPGAATAWVVGLSVAIFVPLKYLYPSKMPRFQITTIAGGLLWASVMSVCVWRQDLAVRFFLVEISLLYLVYYVGMSAWLGGWFRRGDAA